MVESGEGIWAGVWRDGGGGGDGLGQGLDQVELVSVLTGEDGRPLVVLQELLHAAEAPLADAVGAVQRLHLEVLVLPFCFQRHREVTGLRGEERKGEEDQNHIHLSCIMITTGGGVRGNQSRGARQLRSQTQS